MSEYILLSTRIQLKDGFVLKSIVFKILLLLFFKFRLVKLLLEQFKLFKEEFRLKSNCVIGLEVLEKLTNAKFFDVSSPVNWLESTFRSVSAILFVIFRFVNLFDDTSILNNFRFLERSKFVS
ncbi:hypothetical protein D3C85_525690 [compost metagenome]